jgi:hypothetical protein
MNLSVGDSEKAGGFQNKKKGRGPADLPESCSKTTPTGRQSGTVGETGPSLTSVPSRSLSNH